MSKKSLKPYKNFPVEIRVYNKFPMETQPEHIRFAAKLTQCDKQGNLIFHHEVIRKDIKKVKDIAENWKIKYKNYG